MNNLEQFRQDLADLLAKHGFDSMFGDYTHVMYVSVGDECFMVDDEIKAAPNTPPSWDDAPEWAKYLAQDEEGKWYWFESQPVTMAKSWWPDGGTLVEAKEGPPNPNWRETLQMRPEGD